MLRVTAEHIRAICAHAQSTYPLECCGLLLGKLSQDGKILIEAIATENVWSAQAVESFSQIDTKWQLSENKSTHYTIAPEEILRVQKESRDRHLDIIGIYHSHPDHPAIPSEFDRVCAWQAYSYIIVSVPQGKAGELQSWCLDDNHQFQPQEIIVDRLI
ncbi:MAG TPA: M67 family metallopeptidase [Leptolyngbyaceae cyanobacterium]